MHQLSGHKQFQNPRHVPCLKIGKFASYITLLEHIPFSVSLANAIYMHLSSTSTLDPFLDSD